MKHSHGKLANPVFCTRGDTLNLSVKLKGLPEEILHTETLTEPKEYSHWLFADFGPHSAVFLGDHNLLSWYESRFPESTHVEKW